MTGNQSPRFSAELRRLIVVHAMMRSGTHAIIDWIRGHGGLRFFNALLGPGRPRDGRRPTVRPMDFEVWRQRPVPRRRLASTPGDQILVSLEDHEPGFAPFFNVPCETLDVLVLRDPYNTFASRIRMIHRETGGLETAERLMPELVELWMRYARACLDSNGDSGNVYIDYNRWFEEPTYRQAISARLGLRFTDVNFSKVSGHGRGSSFDGRRFDGRNTEMNVMRRFDQLSAAERSIFQRHVCRDEVQALADALWPGRFRGTKSWTAPAVRRISRSSPPRGSERC